MNLANFITMTRLILSLLCFYFAVQPSLFLKFIALALYLIAGTGDILDGYVARRFGLITPFGKIMDPIADKIQTLPPFLYYAATGMILPILVWIMILREVGVTLLRLKAMKRGVVLAAEKSGKIKTFFQHFFVVWTFCFLITIYSQSLTPHVESTLMHVTTGLFYIAFLMTIISGISFLRGNHTVIYGLWRSHKS